MSVQLSENVTQPIAVLSNETWVLEVLIVVTMKIFDFSISLCKLCFFSQIVQIPGKLVVAIFSVLTSPALITDIFVQFRT